MFYNPLHNKWMRIVTAVFGTALMGIALNLFIVPLRLYTGGLMGLCQVLRTLAQEYLGLSFGAIDIAGAMYFLFNIPIMMMGYKNLGRRLAFRTVIGIISYTFFTSVIPIPEKPIVDDYLTGCLLGGILNGTGAGLTLTCGCSTGGLDIVALAMSKINSGFTVGRFSMFFNAALYTACLILFSPETAIYSVIYNFTSNLMLDRVHQQNVNAQALIFTHEDPRRLGDFILEKLGRGVTCWEGIGVYTGNEIHVLCVSMSKYETEELLHAVRKIDPKAFITVQQGVRVYGNFRRKVE